MIVSFDPVAKDVTIDFEDGMPPIGLRADRLVVQHYGDEALLWADLVTADQVLVGLAPVPDNPRPVVSIEPEGDHRWRVTLSKPPYGT